MQQIFNFNINFLSRIIGIDYGLKRVGVAVTDPLQIIAGGLTTVENKNILHFLKDYFLKNEVEAIVVGYPVNMDNTVTEITGEVDKFLDILKKNFPVCPVHKIDERLTSRMASQTILDSGIGKMKRRNKALVDKVSATIILQSYLEQIKR